VVGEYRIDFAALDANGDGSLSRTEVRSNATLTGEFRAVDNDHNGRLSKEELKGWMD
jgi:Ca2+-binding EF-hand superfamily protein